MEFNFIAAGVLRSDKSSSSLIFNKTNRHNKLTRYQSLKKRQRSFPTSYPRLEPSTLKASNYAGLSYDK